MPDLERTFVMIKPDAHARNLSGEILARFERRGFKVRGMRLLRVTPEQAAQHYAEHEGKPFYPGLVEFITSAPVVAMVLEGPAAVATVRTMMGTTNPLDSAPGTETHTHWLAPLKKGARPRVSLQGAPLLRKRKSARLA